METEGNSVVLEINLEDYPLSMEQQFELHAAMLVLSNQESFDINEVIDYIVDSQKLVMRYLNVVQDCVSYGGINFQRGSDLTDEQYENLFDFRNNLSMLTWTREFIEQQWLSSLNQVMLAKNMATDYMKKAINGELDSEFCRGV